MKSYPLKLTSTSNVSGAGYFGIIVITVPDSDNLPSENISSPFALVKRTLVLLQSLFGHSKFYPLISNVNPLGFLVTPKVGFTSVTLGPL